MTANLFGPRPRKTPRKPYRLQLEPLEDRLTPAGPVIYHVTGTTDAPLAGGQVTASGANFNATTLRAAVNAANTDGHTGTDTIQLPAGHYTLTAGNGGSLTITASETIQGAGASVTVIDGGGTAPGALEDRIFLVEAGANAVAFNGVTIEGGHVSGNGAGIDNFANVSVNNSIITGNVATGIDSGGGIANEGSGTLVVNTSTISGNTAGGEGGGIFNSTSFGAGTPLRVLNSTISGNTADEGGGLANAAFNSLASVSGSTFANNTASGFDSRGGAIFNTGGSQLSLVNDTIADNHAATGSGQGGGIFAEGFGSGSTSLLNVTLFQNSAASGGNIYQSGGGQPFTVQNTIIAGSHSLGGNCAGPGSITSLGNNLEDANDCHLSGPNDQINTNPGLDPNGLQNNGGPTQTIALLPGSPAIDHASTTTFPPTDQRGVPRPQGAAPDIGAFEFIPPPPPPPAPAPPASADLALSMNVFVLPVPGHRHRPHKQFTFEMTITNNGPGTAFGALYFEQLPRGLNFVTVVTSQGTFVVAGSFLGVFLGDLPPGATAEIFLTVDAAHGGRFVNTGGVFSQTPDPNLLNNTASIGVNVGIPLFESDFNLVI
jgi:uncharacterized repeat protein (TIGR01451 family)